MIVMNVNAGFMIKKCGAIAGVMVVIGVASMSHDVFATEASLTITLSSSNVSANVAPFADSTGTFIQSEPITIGVTTDNITGYDLRIKANDNTYPERLINSVDSSYLSSISTATNLASIKATDLSTITTSGGNQGVWGYMPSKLNSTANTLFQPTPGTAGHTIEQTSVPNSTANTYTISLGAKVSPLATVGAYTNSFIITAVGNPIPYTITYSENIVTGMPDNIIDGTSGSTSVTISSTTPTRAGYRFLGWCDQATTKSGDTDTCATGHDHQPGGTLTLDATGANNVKLYAMWGLITQSSCSTSPLISTVASGITYMQDITSSNKATVLGNLTQDATYQIKDNRDNQTYCVSKLADGKLWLLDNLALDLTDSTVLNNMSESNTNASNTTLGYLKNGGGTSSDKYAITGVVNWTDSPTYASGYSYSDPLVNLAYKDTVSSNATDQAGDYKIGGYYNYCAASAGSYCYGNGTREGTSTGNATEDICPKGWRMPTGNTSGEYSALANAIYGSTGSTSDATAYANYRAALHLPLSGYFYSGSAYNQGSYGRWWSSTRYGNYGMYYLSANTGYIYPTSNSSRSGGNSVRCTLAD